MSKTTLRSSQLDEKIKATIRVAKEARKESVQEMGNLFVEAIDSLTPKDTNRLANGWIDAGRKAGVTDQPLRPIVASANQDKYISQLNEQIDFWIARIRFYEGRMRWYEEQDAKALPKKNGKRRKRRTSQPYYRKMKRLEKKSRKRLVRSIEELEKALSGDGFLFYDAESYVNRRQNRSLSTVRDKVYGGDGYVDQIGAKIIVTLINKEPHARIVEKHPHLGHPVATSLQIVRAFGIRKISKAYKKKLLEKSPMAHRKVI